jgi:hypothetical protein
MGRRKSMSIPGYKSVHLCDVKPGDIVEGRYGHRQFEVLEVSEFGGRKPVFIKVRRTDDDRISFIEGRRRDYLWRVT